MEMREMVFEECEKRAGGGKQGRSEKRASMRKLRVAAYCRVSTMSRQQETSFEAQRRFYTDRICANPAWEMAGIYADEGVTGTSKEKRRDFKRMLRDCEAGKIDYILTKSISRFARNTLDCITEVRHLQAMGVQIYFEENNLDTGQAYSEMLLTILAAFAQEESRNLSENVKWSIRNGFEQGRDRWSRIYGYTKTEEGTYRIVEKEAAVVREIFRLYERGASMSGIGKLLEARGIDTPGGKRKWEGALVASILDNEKYCGDIQLQKYFTKDHLSHHMARNRGEVRSFYLRDHHAPVIERKTFERVKAIRAMNTKGQNPQYPFGALLICPHCGRALWQRKLHIQYQSKGWNCERGNGACGRFLIRSRFVERAVLEAYRNLETEQLFCGGEEKGEERNTMLQMKREYEAFDTVDYWWLDELVERIEFGVGEDGESDNTMRIFWKCGLVSAVSHVVDKKKEHPEYVAGLYWAWKGRVESGTAGRLVRTKGSRVIDGYVIRGDNGKK